MSCVYACGRTRPTWPRFWRMVLVGLCALILCSCRGPARQSCDTSAMDPSLLPGMPHEAYTGLPAGQLASVPPVGPPGMEQGVPLPQVAAGPWSPPGIRRPWPEDEYLRDGGDAGLPARVTGQWEVHGLESEDTIAHYDTVDGRTIVEPTNRVHIYSPRFGAVRRVTGLVSNNQFSRAAATRRWQKPFSPAETQIVTSGKQHVEANRQVGVKLAETYRSRQGDGVMSRATKARAFQQDVFLPYENLRAVREGVIEASEVARLARAANAAVAWTHKQAVQVILDHQAAMVEVGDQALQSVFTFKAPPGEPKLRVIKVASVQFAEPGDEVAFTIRLDNVGNQRIGNVTIIDNLTTRLEYVPDSAQCSLDAEFFTQPNEGDSLVIRCEIADPLQPGEGGVIRFRCRVR